MIEVSPSKALISCGWDDVPHLSEEAKEKELRETPAHLRDARSKGIPSLGIGAVYPIAESEFVIPPFKVPPHFRRGYGMDVGWNKTAVAWGALDLEQDVLYVIAEHYRGMAAPSEHADAIKLRDKPLAPWQPGFIDPASAGRSQSDGAQLLGTYKGLGLKLTPADNSLEAGILDMHLRLSTGRLKVFATCVNWLMEYRIYRRDKNGRIVRAHNHLMDATRYLARPTSLMAMTIAPTSGMIGTKIVRSPYRQ